MNVILSSLLETIDSTKSKNPDLSVYPKLIGAAISLKEKGTTHLNEWISLLEVKNTPMKEIMAVAAKWDDTVEESMAYYIEITDELKEGLYTSIEAIGY